MSAVTKGSKNIFPKLTTGTDPAVDTEASITVPALEVWEIESVEVTLVTDANVADRVISIVMTDSTGVEISSVLDGTVIAASKTVKYHLAQYGTVPSDTATEHFDQIAKAPKVIVPPGGIIKTVTTLLQATDNYSAIKVIANKFSIPSD